MLIIKKAANILVFLSGILILLHTLIPHIHHDAAISQEHSAALPDWLVDLLTTDLGEGHLEHAATKFDLQQQINQVDADLCLPLSLHFAWSFDLQIHLEKEDKAPFDKYSNDYSLPPLILSKGLRAPPVKA